MLKDAFNRDSYREHYEYIEDSDAKEVFMYLVGLASILAGYSCYPEITGSKRRVKILAADGKWWFSFIVNKKSMLFYFRKHAVKSDRYSLSALQKTFDEVSIRPDKDEWTVRIESLKHASQLWRILDATKATAST